MAELIWDRLGAVDNFCEPFCHSAAVLLLRPDPPRVETANDPSGDLTNAWRATDAEKGGDPEAVADAAVELLNDLDTNVVNVWRALQSDAETVALWADGPVHELDLHAVHRWLVLGDDARAFRERLRGDPDYYDAKRAGRWLLGACMWIGGGWCSVPGETTAEIGCNQQRRPFIAMPGTASGQGVHGGLSEKLPVLSEPGGGMDAAALVEDLTERRPKLSGSAPGSVNNGAGVHAAGPGAKKRQAQKMPNSDRRGDAAAVVQSQQVPLMSAPGRSIHAAAGLSEQVPLIGDPPRGGHRGADGEGSAGWQQVPSLRGDAGAAGMGVHASGRPQLADAYARGRGVHGHDEAGTCAQRRAWLLVWFGRLRDRLRTVRVCCGHWLRVCGSPSVTMRLGVTGVFLDPPYCLDCERMKEAAAWLRGELIGPVRPPGKGKKSRNNGLYATDGASDLDYLVAEVHNYCRERGSDPAMRIALAGYAGEHEELETLGWEVVVWRAQGGYGNQGGENVNAGRERLWFSPHCRKNEMPLYPDA